MRKAVPRQKQQAPLVYVGASKHHAGGRRMGGGGLRPNSGTGGTVKLVGVGGRRY